MKKFQHLVRWLIIEQQQFFKSNSKVSDMDKKTAVRELGQLLPLDDETLQQIVQNSLQLDTQSAISKYWLDLLGQSPDALDFIAKMTSTSRPSSSKPSANTKPSFAKAARPNPSPRTPAVPSFTKKPDPVKQTANAWNQQIPEKPKFNNNLPRLKKATSTTTSELIAKPASTNEKKLSSAKKDKQKKIDNLKDIESVLTMLEIQDSSASKNSACDCKATIHPLFEVAPNCLNCGKIICAKEGLRPCSFCGSPLISPEEMAQIKKLLQTEKDTALMSETPEAKKDKPSSKKPKKITISGGAGVNLWKQQDSLFEKIEKDKQQALQRKEKQVEQAKEIKEQTSELQFYENQKDIDPDLIKAKQNLENLLNFQTNSAERTKIIDQASDFELPTGSNLNMWSSSVEKALQLKKQQRQLRRQEKKEKQLTGRGKQVMSISIGKNGKAVINSKLTGGGSGTGTPDDSDFDDDDSEDEIEKKDIAELEEQLRRNKDSKTEEEFKVIWNPDKDAAKWERPKYIASHDTPDKGSSEDQGIIGASKLGRIQQISVSNTGDDADIDLDEMVTFI
ncbi:hypothetical protein WICPIJ_004116 [Wickerhamomyces pijperi]|uniref:TRIP4/RQT4 C2HC5-type zinc finger domain-containing protein n=1 Tax=Wickerhamomyces pijperi TaxID=599730 RepID=A0A9P8TN84_WICPI|nr:hypothetical protein WICPIJ_004116 [Wickerhamomyces pijperi]